MRKRISNSDDNVSNSILLDRIDDFPCTRPTTFSIYLKHFQELIHAVLTIIKRFIQLCEAQLNSRVLFEISLEFRITEAVIDEFQDGAQAVRFSC